MTYTGPLCGDPTCEICPTQKDLDAWHARQQQEARDIVRSLLHEEVLSRHPAK